MNKKIFNPGRQKNSLSAGIMLLLLLAASACQKREFAVADSPDNLTYISTMLEGEIISCNIANEQDTDGLAIICGEGKEIIVLEKIPSKIIEASGSIQNAELIYSKFGVLVRDTDTKKTWLYPNNDAKSRQRFESVRPYLPENFSLSEIAGTMRIKLSADRSSFTII
jgi:hypothetical protein